ncbi:MAG: hypothetical protein HY619_08155, partial [Thaumarchaeota archaeon]|nr:hypothetical protein [Nitrososphaerota archaeon]
MKIRVEVRVLFESSVVAKAAYLALEPDNVGIPKGLNIRMKKEGKILDVSVYSEAGVRTLIATVDEILEKIYLSQEVVGEVK